MSRVISYEINAKNAFFCANERSEGEGRGRKRKGKEKGKGKLDVKRWHETEKIANAPAVCDFLRVTSE